MMNTVLVQCVTCYVNSNSAQKSKNVCRILTGKVDDYVQLLLTNVDPHDCSVPREALPRAWIANSPPPEHEDGNKSWLFSHALPPADDLKVPGTVVAPALLLYRQGN